MDFDLLRFPSMGKHFLSPCHIVPDFYPKGAVRLTPAAHQAIVRRNGKGPIVLCHGLRYGVLLDGQIQKLGHSSNIDVGRTGLAVVAIHTPPGHTYGSSGAENMSIAPFLYRCVIIL